MFLLTLLSYSIPESVAQQLVCPPHAIDQITDTPTGNSEDPSINADGRFVAFRSNADLNGTNPNLVSQIYLFDRLLRILTQITDDPMEASVNPSINADGNYIAFASDADINNGNPTNERQIYVFNATTGLYTQITADPDERSGQPSINANAMYVAFESDADFTGQNMDNSQEIFLANVADGTITQITQDPNPGFNIDSSSPSISGDASIIAFDSESNITGQNPNELRQIFFFNVNNGTFTQVSQDTGGSSALQAAISADGAFIVFRSTQNINGGNPDNSSEIFLYEIATGDTTQITFTSDGGFGQNPSINGDGSLLAFESPANFNGNNPNLIREIWVYDVTNAVFTQVTDVSDGLSEHARISADGSSVAFESRSDINGGNPELNREVYVATCLDPMTARNIPTLSEWGLIVMSGVLGMIGLFAIRRRNAAA